MNIISDVERIYRNEVAAHVYYNVSIRNTGQTESVASYSETLTMPLIDKCSDYFMAVARFNIPTNNIPLMIFPVQPYPNTDPNKSIYSVTLSYNGVDSQAWLIWTPERVSTTALAKRSTLTDVAPHQEPTEYYYMFSYQHFLDILNKALSDALAGLTGAPAGAVAPFVTYNPSTHLMTVTCQSNFYDCNTANPIKLFFNSELHTLLDNMQFLDYGLNNALGKDHQLVVQNCGNNVVGAPTAVYAPLVNIPDAYYQMTQEYPNLVDFNSFSGIVIKTGNIPVRTESVPLPQKFGSTFNAYNGIAHYEPIVTDFDATTDLGFENMSAITYVPLGEYRMVDLMSDQELKSLSFSIYWKDQYGNLYPLLVARNSVISMKILFRHKAFNIS